jgi:predicted MFS family arabinose efflux permease
MLRLVRERLRLFVAVFRDPNLRRIELAFAGFNMAEYASWIAILVFAYDRGGATMAAFVATIQLIPAGIIAPFAAYAGDRFRRDRVLVAGYVAQAVSLAATATALLAHAPVAIIYGAAAVAATSLTFTRPAQASLLPSITRTPEDLTAANVASSVIEGVGVFLGPAIAGVILKFSGPGTVVAVFAGVSLAAALLTSRMRVDSAAVTPPARVSAGAVLHETLGGFRVLRREREARLLVLLLSSGAVVIGALDVLFVASAIDLLHMGDSGAGFLSSAFGIGGILGATAAIALVGRPRLTPPLAGGAALFGVPLAALAIAPAVATAPLLIAAGGGGRTLADISGRTLLQRIAPDEVLTRVFGVLEGLGAMALAVGAVGASALVAACGIRIALVVTGAFVPVTVLLAGRELLAIDREAVVPDALALALFRRIPIFSPLPAPAIERVMANLIPVTAAAGDVLIREGDPGDRFYVIAEGSAVVVTAAGGQVIDRGPGDYFGEIALLRDIPRTATVTATSRVRLFALERDHFLQAVTGHPQSIEAADGVVEERLGRQR